MRNPEVDLDRDHVACLPGLDVGFVVGELQAFAEVQVALGGMEALLRGGELGQLLHVGGVVLLDGVDEGSAAGGGGSAAGAARGRGGEYAMGESGRNKGKKGGSGEMHGESWFAGWSTYGWTLQQ